MISTVLHLPMPVLHFLATVLNSLIPVLDLPLLRGGMAMPGAGMATTVLHFPKRSSISSRRS